MDRIRKFIKRSSKSDKQAKEAKERKQRLRRSASMPLNGYAGSYLSGISSATTSRSTFESQFGNDGIVLDISRENMRQDESSDDESVQDPWAVTTDLLDKFPQPPKLNAYTADKPLAFPSIPLDPQTAQNSKPVTPFVHRQVNRRPSDASGHQPEYIPRSIASRQPVKQRTTSNASYQSFSRPTRCAYPDLVPDSGPSATSSVGRANTHPPRFQAAPGQGGMYMHANSSTKSLGPGVPHSSGRYSPAPPPPLPRRSSRRKQGPDMSESGKLPPIPHYQVPQRPSTPHYKPSNASTTSLVSSKTAKTVARQGR